LLRSCEDLAGKCKKSVKRGEGRIEDSGWRMEDRK
jgi:hypothetical protein